MNAEETSERRQASPRYPLYDLGQCVEGVQKVFSKDRRNVTSRDAVAKHLGYKSENGASKRVTASMLQFGLLEDAGRGHVKVSEMAHGILKPDSPSERADLLREALKRPKIFESLLGEYGVELPSNLTIQNRLERTHKFTEDAAVAVIKSLRNSIEYVRSAATSDDADDGQDEADGVPPAERGQAGHGGAEGQGARGEQPMAYRSIEATLSVNCVAEVRITGSIGRAEHERLKKWLASVVPGWAQFLTLDDEVEVKGKPTEVTSEEVAE